MDLPLDPALDGATALFAGLRAQLEAAGSTPRPTGLRLREVPAPHRLAPQAFAIAAEALHGDREMAHGRLVVLHDPEGQAGWHGRTRVVAFVAAEVDPEMARDPALPEVAWQWVTEALAARRVAYRAAGGTVTRTVSRRFGALRPAGPPYPVEPGPGVPVGRPPDLLAAHGVETNEVEVRASWTAVPDPAGRLDLGEHLQAWCDLLTATAGLPPPGVAGLTR